MEQNGMKVAILGAGVAGISSAIALRQSGFDVTVYERRDGPSSIGAGIVIWPNASFVLAQLGLLEEVKAVSGLPTRMCRYSDTGEDLGSIDIGTINTLMGYPSLSVLRNDFQDILVSRLKSLGIEIQYSHAVVDIATRDDGQAEVLFQSGDAILADVIIGADGRMASYARQYVNNDNAPVYQGFINWIGVFESETDVFADICVADYWGVGERFGIVPITRRKAYWAGAVASAEIGPRDPAEYAAELRTIFSRWPEPVNRVVEGLALDRINKIYIHDHDPIAVWHKANLLVIGDAAHAPLPTSGQGACQALEDAWHLCHCLRENPRDLQQAFSEFTAIRLQKTTDIIMAARNFAASLFNSDEAFCQARNERSRKTDYSSVATAMSAAWARGLSI